MNAQMHTLVKKNPDRSLFAFANRNLLQRQSICSQHTIIGGECSECHQRCEGMVQRAAINAAPAKNVPPIVYEVLSSAGQLLEAGTRALMEPRFGHDFSQTRVYTDGRAAKSAQAVNALAYTVGRDVVFETGQYLLQTSIGRHLLAHELTHVQRGEGDTVGISPQALSISGPTDTIAHQVVSANISCSSLRNKFLPVVHRQSPSIRLPRGIHGLDPAEGKLDRSVYSGSLIYSKVYLSGALGAQGRPFTIVVPFLGTVFNIGPATYRDPGSNRNLLIHELAHCWQSQRYFDPAGSITNSIQSQILGGNSAYCYIPGKAFRGYVAEKVAQQVENCEPAIVSHVASVSAGSIDFQNILSLSIPRWKKRGKPGVRY